MSATTTNRSDGFQQRGEYDITEQQQEALEHLAEQGNHTEELAEQLLGLIE